MANKRAREENVRKDKERRYALAKQSIAPLEAIGLVASVLVLLLFFLNWAYVHNTDVGVEVKINGFNTLIASLSGNYSSSESLVGDMAIPFYYYAKTYCETLGVYTIIAFFLTIATLTISILNTVFAVVKKSRVFNYPLLVLSLLTAVTLLLCFITALSMKNAEILSVYCGGNVKCSIRSLAIIPAIFTLVIPAVSVIQIVKAEKIKNILK